MYRKKFFQIKRKNIDLTNCVVQLNDYSIHETNSRKEKKRQVGKI